MDKWCFYILFDTFPINDAFFESLFLSHKHTTHTARIHWSEFWANARVYLKPISREVRCEKDSIYFSIILTLVEIFISIRRVQDRERRVWTEFSQDWKTIKRNSIQKNDCIFFFKLCRIKNFHRMNVISKSKGKLRTTNNSC